MERGKMIAIYGINGIGKTTQAELLVEYLKSRGKNAVRLKYPVYDLKPEGPFIHQYLRNPEFRRRNELSVEALQKKYADNRERYEPELIKRLDAGEWIVAEDYTGTGIAWGLTRGADLEYLEEINGGLFKEDLSILMHGNRFLTAIEAEHKNETDIEAMRICKNFHFLLARRFGWKIVVANREIEAVQAGIRTIADVLFG